MAAAKLKVGDVVLTIVDPRSNNGSDEAPALVTKVSEDGDTVNVRAFLDGSDTLWLTNVPYSAKRPEEPEEGDEDAEPAPTGVPKAAFKS